MAPFIDVPILRPRQHSKPMFLNPLETCTNMIFRVNNLKVYKSKIVVRQVYHSHFTSRAQAKHDFDNEGQLMKKYSRFAQIEFRFSKC